LIWKGTQVLLGFCHFCRLRSPLALFWKGVLAQLLLFLSSFLYLLNIHTIIRIFGRLSIGKFKKNELIYSNPIRARLQGILVEKGKVTVGFCLKMIGLDAEMGFTGTPTPAPVQKLSTKTLCRLRQCEN